MAARCPAESAAAIGMVGSTQRSDSMVSIPSPAARTSDAHAEADSVAEQMTHRPPRRVDMGFAQPGPRVEPGAMDAGDRAIETGDGGDHRGPGLGRCSDQRGSSSADGSGAIRFRRTP